MNASLNKSGLIVRITLCCVLAVALSIATAQKAKPLPAVLQAMQPVNIFPSAADTGYVFIDKNKDSKPTKFSVTKKPDGSSLITAEVLSATPNHFSIQAGWKSTAAIAKGDVLLARFTLRAVYAKQESGDAVVNFYVQQVPPPAERIMLVELSVGPEWKTVEVPFTALQSVGAGEAAIVFTFGALAQKVEISDVQVLDFGQKTTLAALPSTKLTYAGRESGAAWRAAALKRIDSLRTAPLNIQVVDAKRRPVKGATVQAKLLNPAFIFGTAVSADYIVRNDTPSLKYKQRILELFNAVTIGNHLKWPVWRDPQKRAVAYEAVNWILKNNLRLRGHNLVWPGKKFTPGFFASQPGFGPGFADSITAHVIEETTAMKGKVYGWDVINEMIHEKDYFSVMPRTAAADWFRLARKYDSSATLFINEYSMLNNVASPANINAYLELIKELQGYGAPIDAIGVQGHVGRQPRNPAEVLSDLDLFLSTGLPVQITEFDVNTPDEELQADYTRDFLIACYSHPAVNGFTMWGFWEADHWKPDAAMFRKDWSAKPAAAVWREWVLNKWKTNLTSTTTAKGEVAGRGHLGEYEITVTKGASTVKKTYQLTKSSLPLTVTIK